MALGNPLLATWADDDLIRTYEYVEGVFVPLGVSAAIVNSPLSTAANTTENISPGMTWTHDDKYLLVENSPNGVNGANVVHSLNFDGSEVASQTSGASTNMAGGIYKPLRDVEGHIYRSSGYNGGSAAAHILADGSLELTAYTLGLTNGADAVNSVDVAPNGEFAILCGIGTAPARISLRTNVGTWPPVFAAATNITTSGIEPDIVAISGDSQTLMFLSIDEGLAQTWFYDGSFSKVADVSLPTGIIHRALASPDGRHLAVSVNNGGVFATRMFVRQVGYFLPVQDIANFGEELAFSADGILIMDAPNKRCFIREGGTFVDHDTAMINIAVDLLSASFSLAPVFKSAKPDVYIGALGEIGNETIDLDNLKFTLLTSSASFDETDTTLSQVTNAGAYEVTGGAWPTGGILLENVAGALATPNYDYATDPITWLAFGSDLTWRYAVIYDATSNQPLVFLDYYGQRTVASSREVHFNFPDDVFLRLTR